MRTAPSFMLQTSTSRGWRLGVCALCAVCVAVLLTWLLQGHLLRALKPQTWWAALPAVGLLISAARIGVRQPLSLGWDGTRWCWKLPLDAQQIHGDVQVRIDLGRWLLLSLVELRPGAPRWRSMRWVALSEADVGAAWHGLRCALYSSRRMTAPTPPAPLPPPATPGLPHSG